MSGFTQDDLAQGVGQLLIELWALQKRVGELTAAQGVSTSSEMSVDAHNGHVDLPQPTSAAERTATREED